MPSMWSWILKGYRNNGDIAGVHRTITSIESRGYQDNHNIIIPTIDSALQFENIEILEQYWQRLRVDFDDPHLAPRSAPVLHRILKWCLGHGRLEMGNQMVKDVMRNGNPIKLVWDAIFVWAAGTKKSVDEIDRMMSVMESSDSSDVRRPDVRTINHLVGFAIQQNDPYMAERFIALGRQREIQPNAYTYALQIDYRLGVGDVDGSLIAYKALAEEQRDGEGSAASAEHEAVTINRLIVALCKTQRHDFDTIMNVTMDLADRHARFASETVSTLTLLHLNRDEIDDATDLLNTHAFHFSSIERAEVRNAIQQYALDPCTSAARAWQAYSILRTVFDELPREDRTDLMNSFFARERVDVAVRVFQHMRQQTRADTIPTIDTYVACFMGLAKMREIESLEVVYNLLKLDYNIDVSTYLRNALMVSYSACGRPRKALGFWDDIVASKEGPNYNSIHIALRACEKSNFGDIKAQEIWRILRRRNVELDQALWASYAGALAGNGDNELAIRTIEEAEANGEVEVDAFLLGSMCDGSNGPLKQEEIEGWARTSYTAQWKRLEEIGWTMDEVMGRKRAKIDRRVAP